MSHKYNGNNESEIPNTDNEDTILITGLSEAQPSNNRELPPLKRMNRRTAGNSTEQSNAAFSSNPLMSERRQSQLPPQFPNSSPPPPRRPNNNSGGQQSMEHNDGYYAPPPMPPEQPRPAQKRNVRPEPQPHHEAPRKKEKHHHKSLLRRMIGRLFKIVLILFLIVFGMYSCTSICLISKVSKEPSQNRTHYADNVGRDHVRSVLVIGTDGRNAEEKGRSDSMILVSLNTKTNEIIMTSFMRDCYVEIPNNGWDKLNHSYAYGGAELLMDTIEYNFDVRIDDYVCIDFASFVSVVDAVGGVDIEVSDAEAEQINIILISEVNGLMGDDPNADLLSSGGKLHLNGKQALSYSRIRNVGNNDFERTERQRRVMSLIIAKLKSFRPSVFKNLASDVIPDVSTNMTDLNMYLLSLRLPFALTYSTKQIQIPAEGTYSGADVDVGNVLQIDREANMDVIEREVFAK